LNAAHALCDELEEFERLASGLRTLKLHSQHEVARGGEVLGNVAECHGRISTHVAALMSAITSMRERQSSLASEVETRAAEIQARADVLKGLQARFTALGSAANALNAELKGTRELANSPQEATQALDAVVAHLGELATQAESIAHDSGLANFADVERQAEGLRQQLLSAKNKMGLLKGAG
jgi:hypothetical protein